MESYSVEANTQGEQWGLPHSWGCMGIIPGILATEQARLASYNSFKSWLPQRG